ncbi:MAG: dTDP-4-dehydrorhamnose 3,5-epimerase [Deltaproteobacteria bacterium]|nr:dTDP-4-dehydrorhamnose 3,5-epimerase [Deltaproteobacteria bacterium]
MNVLSTKIAGVHVVETTPFQDQRGKFARFFCERELQPVLGGRKIVQINFSRTTARGALRGMHFQRKPHAEMKLVRCLQGKVWDVALDLRAGSPTFKQWHAEELTPENARLLVIPEGCAHGFQVLEPNSELLYLHTAFYEPQAEGGVLFNDPAFGITWPLEVKDLSHRDQQHPLVSNEFKGVET